MYIKHYIYMLRKRANLKKIRKNREITLYFLTLADFFKLPQEKMRWRLTLSVVLLVAGIVLSQIPTAKIWQYFGWFNQTLAMFTLWVATVYLRKEKKLFWIALIPATFMTAVSATYVAYDKLFFNLPIDIAQCIGITVAAVTFVAFLTFSKEKQ